MARTVGRLTLAEARLDFLRALLLNEYQGHAAFIAELIGLIAYHERLLEALPRVINPPVGMSIDQPEDAWNAADAILARRPRLIHLHFYQDKVRDCAIDGVFAAPGLPPGFTLQTSGGSIAECHLRTS